MFVVAKKKEQNKKQPVKIMSTKKVQKNSQVTGKKKSNSSRVKKNEYLYDDRTEYELSLTKQQKFNFDSSNLEDEIENIFKKKNTSSKNRIKKTIIVEKKVYPKKTIGVLVILLLLSIGFSIYHFVTFDHNKVKIEVKKKIVEKDVIPENIVFLGDSLTEFYDLEKFYPDSKFVNSGIGGNVTDNILEDMEKRVYQYNPSKVFLLIGTNDLQQGKSADEIFDNIKEIMVGIKNNRPKAELYIESLYPVNREIKNNGAQNRHNEDIKEINEKIEKYCNKENITYIDMYSLLEDENGNLKEEYTQEGLHLSQEGYKIVTEKISTYLSLKNNQ